jgi:peroxisomal membrane protein 2
VGRQHLVVLNLLQPESLFGCIERFPGVLSFLQEVLASRLAHVSRQSPQGTSTSRPPTLTAKALKMAIYGAFISAPMGHFLVGILQKSFSGKTSKLARFGQVLASNLFVAPIQAFGKPHSMHSYASAPFH